MSTELTIAGERIHYLAAGSPAAPGLTPADDLLVRDHPRLRRILVRLTPTGPLGPMLLHWSDASDLTALDELIATGDDPSTYLENAVVGEFAHHLCPQCGRAFRVIDSSPAITLGVPLDRIRAHTYQETCPTCQTPTRRALLEFLT